MHLAFPPLTDRPRRPSSPRFWITLARSSRYAPRILGVPFHLVGSHNSRYVQDPL